MYDGYFEMGGNEILNRERAYVYARESDCPITWLRLAGCPGLDDALGDEPYENGTLEAPWFDSNAPATARFYGAYPLSITGISDSTRTATITEGILDGGVIQGGRRAVRQVRCTALLIAEGMDALEAGLSWLDAALDQEGCSTHSGSCGEVDACFFVSCPPERQPGESDDDYEEDIRLLRRQMHGVVTISGPIVTQTLQRGNHYGYIVEFTVAAGTPFVFSMPETISLIPSPATVVQDTPFNLAPYPSAELADVANTTVATNYSTNPSVETNATGWAIAADGTNILTANITGARSTLLAAVGTASYLVTWTAPSGGTAAGAWFGGQQEVTIPTTTGMRFSISCWGAGQVASGTATLGVLEVVAYWRAGGSTLRTDSIGSISGGSGAVSLGSILPPSGATSVIVRTRQFVSTWASGAVVRCFADALAVTVP